MEKEDYKKEFLSFLTAFKKLKKKFICPSCKKIVHGEEEKKEKRKRFDERIMKKMEINDDKQKKKFLFYKSKQTFR